MRRRASGEVSSSIRLDHGDILVMDGLAQSEYEHRTMPELQGPRVILTCSWVTQHIASCPPTQCDVLCFALVCARFSRARSPCGGHRGNKIFNYLFDDPPLFNLGCASFGSALGLRMGGGVATAVGVHPPGVALPSMGSCTLGWEKAVATFAAPSSPKTLLLLFPLGVL